MSVERLFSSAGLAGDAGTGGRFETIGRIPILVQIVLGGTTMAVADLMALRRGAIVPLDRRVGEPVDIVANGRVVARGELQILDDRDERFAISVTEIVGGDGTAAAGRFDV